MENTAEETKPETETQAKPQETLPKDEPQAADTVVEDCKPQPESEDGEAEDLAAKGFDKLNDGKRNLACDEHAQAVDALAEACQLLSAKYGEEADELSESYYYYGRALLELARMENGVLGNALDGVSAEEENEEDLSESEQFEKPSKTEDSERDELRNQIYTAMSAEEKESQDNNKTSSEPAASTESTAEKEEKTSDETTEQPSEKIEAAEKTGTTDEKTETTVEGDKAKDKSEETEDNLGEGDEEQEGGEEDEEKNMEEEGTSSQDDEDNPDDVPNLQLSWEVLELAKKIYLRQVEKPDCDKAIKIKLSDVYRSLGEVSLETGSSEQAVLDMNSCLTLQKQCLESDSRYIAETHYQLGNAYLLNKDYKLGVEQLKLAKSVLETRIVNLETKVKEDSENSDKLSKELTDLKQLLPDILAKVEDAEDESRNAEVTENKVKAALNASTTTIGFGDASDSAATNGTPIEVKKANDISNLVRKRKPEEQSNGDVTDVKKAKSDVNASGDKENGHVDQPMAEVESQ